MKTKPHTFPEPNRRASKNIFQVVFFITILFFYSSCSNNAEKTTEQAVQENQKPETVKQDTVSPPRITVLDTLADTNKPKQFFLEKTPKPQTITIPLTSAQAQGKKCIKRWGKDTIERTNEIPLAPLETKFLQVLKNEKGEVIKDKDGSSFILGEAGGFSNFSNYSNDNGLALDAIACGFRDKTGNLWFGTDGGGVSRYDGKSFTNFTTAQGLANNTVFSITEDKTGNLWFGTYGGGVSRYDGKSFTNFTTAQGLANNTVWSITEDKTGNLWFGTDGGGVSRYDGSRVEAIEAALQRGEIIPERTQQDLKKNGKLVKSFTNFTTAQGLANNTVRSITEDKTGNLWCGTYGGGVSRYDGRQSSGGGMSGTVGKFTNFTTAQGLANNTVLSITEDKTGNLWFGTSGGGVSRYDGSRVEAIEAALQRGEIIPERTQQDLKKENGKLVKSFTNFTTAQGLANNTVRSITEDKTGNLWFGTYGGGVSRYDGRQSSGGGMSGTVGKFTNFTTAQGLANNSVRSITEDKTGNLWFGTDGGGVSRYDGKSFTNFTTAQGLANNSVRSITEDKTGNLWFGTDGGGVSRYDGKSFTNFTTAQGLAHNTVRSITEDKTGNLWFGTYRGGVSRYDGKSFTNFTTAQGLANNSVRSITEDKTGNLWFGTDGGGVSRYDGRQSSGGGMSGTVGKFTNFTTAQGLANNTVWSITEDKTGNLWFGTDGGGVSRYDGKSFTNFTTAQGLANNTVFSITEDKTGNLWFGTSGGGVSRYDGKSFTNFTTAQGLPDNTVTQVVITKEQNIAIGTNLGVGVLVSFTPKLRAENTKNNIPAQNNMNNQELKNYTPVIEIYNSNTGYPVKDVNAGQNGMFMDSKGIIWAGTGSDKTGLVRFDYAALNKNKMPPAVFIQSVKINNENICWYNLRPSPNGEGTGVRSDNTTTPPNITEEVTTLGRVLNDAERNTMYEKFRDIKFEGITKFYPLPENLILPHRNNNVTFDFAAIEPAKPYLVRYQYILEGYYNDWSPITNATTAKFGNIYEGSYTFKLKAQSPFGVWSEPITYSFKVLPPWWRTWWMYSFYGIAAIAIVVIIVWWNGRRLRAKAIELTEEVRKATVTIVKQKEIVEEKSEKLGEALKDIKDSINYANRIQRAMLPHRRDIWAAFPQSFVLFKPKDIVSGDFYFFHKNNESVFIAVADCTGHGVPGAFMSMVGAGKLNDAVTQSSDTSEILSLLNKGIKTALKQSDSDESTRDGMDIALVSLKFKDESSETAANNSKLITQNFELYYAGANRPLWLIRNGQAEVEEIKATKRAIGGLTEDNQHFESHELKLQQGDTFYICTDGYADQFGGAEGKKLMTKKLKEMLLEIQSKTMKEQKQHLANFVENWKAGTEQVDDILIIGIRV